MKNCVSDQKVRNQIMIKVFKMTWFLIPFSGLLNYYLVSKAISAGYFDVAGSTIVIAGFFPAAIMYAGLIVGASIAIYYYQQQK